MKRGPKIALCFEPVAVDGDESAILGLYGQFARKCKSIADWLAHLDMHEEHVRHMNFAKRQESR